MIQHKFQILALSTSLLVLAKPDTSVKKINYRGMSTPIVISSQEVSPAAAALEDSRRWEENYVLNLNDQSQSPAIELKAGEKEADRVIPNYKNQAQYKPLKGIKLNYQSYVAKINSKAKKPQVVEQNVVASADLQKIRYQRSKPIVLVHKSSDKSIKQNTTTASAYHSSTQSAQRVSDDKLTPATAIETVRAQGNIQLVGLPMVFEDQVVELTYESGILFSPVSYSFSEGFEFEALKGQGKLTAKLWSKSNGLIGGGELELTSDMDYSRLIVKVEPTSYAHKGSLVSTDVTAQNAVYELSMDASSKVIVPKKDIFNLSLDVKSQPLMIAKLKNQKTSTMFSFNHKTPCSWPIYTDDYALFLANLLNKRATALETTALISGKVTYLGEPLSNVKLVVHQGLLEKSVTYFSSSLPNPSLESTSSTGDFVLATDIDRPAAISVIINNKVVHTRDVPIGLGQVSHVNIEIGPQQSMHYELSSAFEDQPMNANLYLESSEVSFPIVNGLGKLYSYRSDTAEKVFVEMENPDYISFTTWVHSDFKYGKLQTVKKSWFYNLTKDSVNNFDEYSSIYIGFVSGADYQVNLDGKAQSHVGIIYFDSEGQLIDGGKSEGGFIVYNIPPGQRSINVEAIDLDKSHTQFFNAYQSQNFSNNISF